MAKYLRRIVAIECESDRLFASIDEAKGTTGVVIVSGGNELRCGAHRGMALLAERLAAEGIPVFRFDRRGVGDSEGENRGYAASAPDIAAALAAFRREQPQLRHIVAYGNCDAATALVLFGQSFDGLVLANPWLGDEQAPLPPAALRAHYARKLRDPSVWKRLLAGRGSWFSDLRQLFARVPVQPLSRRFVETLGTRPATVVLAARDRTAQVFAAAVTLPAHIRVVEIDTASHSFAGQGDALEAVIREAVSGASNRDRFR